MTTSAGKALLAAVEALDYDAYDAARHAGFEGWAEAIHAIEVEAAADPDLRLRAMTAARDASVVEAERLRGGSRCLCHLPFPCPEHFAHGWSAPSGLSDVGLATGAYVKDGVPVPAFDEAEG